MTTDTASAIQDICHLGYLMADMNPGPPSPVPNPDGSAQPETRAEYTRRIIHQVIPALIRQGLLAVPDDIDHRLLQPVPLTPR